jgi:hypothetical protein
MREDDTSSLMVINSVEVTTDSENGDNITVTGQSIESYIARRIVWSQTNLKGLVTDCITTLLNQNLINPTNTDRQIDGIQIGSYADCNISIKKQVTGDNLMDAIIDILSTYNYGFSLTFNGSNLEFNIIMGTDRSYNQTENPYVTFSPEYDNILTSDYLSTSLEYKNVALVAGEGTGVDRKTYTVGAGEGLNRLELYVDARDISSETEDGTLTTAEYNALLAEKGNEALSECPATQNYSGEIEASVNYTYGQDYFLGDVVNLTNDFNMTDSVRIIEIIESWNENGYTCVPTFENKEEQ